MSLVRIAARIAAVEALKGRTLVGDNVLDSEIGSLQVDADGTLKTDEDAPFITVYTDAASTKGSDNSLRAMLINGATDIVFEAGITAAMTETNTLTDESTLIGLAIPATDRAFEFYLDIISRQIGDVITDPDNEWAEIFRSLINSMVTVERLRTSGADAGTRLAGHQTKITVNLVADPVRGQPVRPESGMGKFLAKATTLNDPVVAQQLAVMLAQIDGDPRSWKMEQRRHGMTVAEMDGMLLNPIDDTDANIAGVDIDAQPFGPSS